MAKLEQTPGSVNRRTKDRIAVPGLSASIRQQGLLSSLKLFTCEVIDVNRGGLQIVSQKLFLSVPQKLVIHLTYQGHYYCARGMVVYRRTEENLVYYGIMFIHVPFQFDQMIEQWMALPLATVPKIQKSKAQKISLPTPNELNKEELIPDSQRRIETRYSVSDITMQIKKSGFFNLSKFIKCDVINISQGGVRFNSNAYYSHLMDKLDLVISHKEDSFRTNGVISYYHCNNEKYYYGIEFNMITPQLIRFIDGLRAGSNKSDT